MAENYDSKRAWCDLYQTVEQIAYPAEAVIRIFKGSFPNLSLPKNYDGANILDIGYGDGRHFPLFESIGLSCYGVEIDEHIVKLTQQRLENFSIAAKLSVGSAARLHFPNEFFDYVIAWNSSYYMSLDNLTYEDHVSEMLRVLKPGGNIIISVPSYTSFVFEKAEMLDNDYAIIRNDFFGARNGEVMRRFRNIEDLRNSFDGFLKDQAHAEIKMDWFGLNYHWLVLVGSKGK